MAFNRALIKRKEHKSPESRGNHKIKMASMLRMWITREITVKMARNFHFRNKNPLRWMILESRQRNKEKGSPIKLHLAFYF